MADIFDTVASEKKRDVFDEVKEEAVDVFDRTAKEIRRKKFASEMKAGLIEKMSDPDLAFGAPQDPRFLESLLTLGSSAIAQPLAGLAAIGELVNIPGDDLEFDLENYKPRDVDRLAQAGKTLQSVQQALTYQPRTEAGKVATEAIAAPFEAWHNLSTRLGDVGENYWTPLVQSLIEVSPMALPLVPKAVRKISPVKVSKAKAPTQMAEAPESILAKSEFEQAFLGKKPVAEGEFTDLGKYTRKPTTLEGPEIAPKGEFTKIAKPGYKRVPIPKVSDRRLAAVKTPKGVLEGEIHADAYWSAVEKFGQSQVDDWMKYGKLEPGHTLKSGKFITNDEAIKFWGSRETGFLIDKNIQTPKQIKTTVEYRHGVGTFKKDTNTNILYSGIPPSEFGKVGNLWTKYVGGPVWDKLITQKIPKMLEKVPGGKAVNRALLYDYRGKLPKTEKYIASMEEMTRNQAIGREYAIDLGNRLQSYPEDIQLKIADYIKGEGAETRAGIGKLKKHDLTSDQLKIADEAVDVLSSLGKQAVDVGLLNEKVFFKNLGKYMPRLYTKHEYAGLLTQYGIKKPTRLDLTRFKQRKEIPKEIRKEMGEILTPGYPVAKGITQLTHDIEMAKFFSGISKNPQWAIPKNAYRPKSPWAEPVEIPEGFVSLGSNKKLGALNDAYVHPEIFQDLQQSIKIMETPERVWRKTLGYWKFGKVIISPKTHVRNMMSNSILAHLGGMPMYEQPIYLTKAAKAMVNKSEYWKVGKQQDLLRSTFTNAELKSLFDQVETNMVGVKGGGIVDALGKTGQAWDKSKQAMSKAAKLYEAEEQWFKMAKMIHNIERKGMNPKLAAADAEKWLFNYQKVTKFQEKYRSKWYGAPFATFTMKALPRIAEAAIKTPWRFALPAGMIYMLERAAMNEIGDNPEQFKSKKEMRPEYMKGNFMGVIPNFARYPFVDDYGREHYLNLSYILPWGDIAEGGDFMGIPGSVRPMSMPFINEAFQQIANKDIFFEEDIVKAEDVAGLEGSAGKKPSDIFDLSAAGRAAWKKRIEHAGKTFLPTPVVDIEKAVNSLKGKPDSRGRFRNPKIVAADVLAGIKIYPIDYADQFVRFIYKNDPTKGATGAKINREIKSLAIKKKAMADAGRSTKYYEEQIEKKMAQLNGLAKQVAEKGKIFKKTK